MIVVLYATSQHEPAGNDANPTVRRVWSGCPCCESSTLRSTTSPRFRRLPTAKCCRHGPLQASGPLHTTTWARSLTRAPPLQVLDLESNMISDADAVGYLGLVHSLTTLTLEGVQPRAGAHACNLGAQPLTRSLGGGEQGTRWPRDATTGRACCEACRSWLCWTTAPSPPRRARWPRSPRRARRKTPTAAARRLLASPTVRACPLRMFVGLIRRAGLSGVARLVQRTTCWRRFGGSARRRRASWR